MKEIFNWLITSSADPHRVSLAVRGALVFVLGIITQMIPLACAIGVCISADLFPPVIDAVVNIVEAALILIGSIAFIVGVLRKIYLERWAHPAAKPEL
jgi:hypothetical protein